MHSVFLSYRKSDTGLEASRLAQCLQPVFGRRIVFRDVDSIVPGSDWQAVLKGEVARAKVVLVLIGPAWVSELASRIERRDVDYHRVEMAIALAKGIPVIPVLLREAAPPPTSSLPDDLAPLITHQAITMRDESWSEDVDRLVDAIGRPYRWDLLALRAVIALVAAPIALW